MTTAVSRRWTVLIAPVGTRTATTLGLIGLLLGCGWALGAEHAKILFLAFALIGMCVLALSQHGALIGILVLASLNGLPFIDTSTLVTSKLALADIAVIALIAVASMWNLLNGGFRPLTRAARLISRFGLLLFLWCSYVMAQTVIGQHVPFLRAIYLGRDFILFALLLVVLPSVRLKQRDANILLGILATGVCVFAVGQIMIATGLGHPGNVIHFHYTLAESGLTRVYSNMTDLVTASLSMSIAATMLARTRIVRAIALPIMLLLIVSTVVQLTRARWIGIVIGVILVSLWLIVGSNAHISATVRRRLFLAVGALGVVGVIATLTIPSITSGEVVTRLTSIFTDLQSGAGTVAVREQVTNTMTSLLGEHWPFGLGFVPPFSHYFLGLPGGSIRDPDVGALNAVMTMGVLGAILIYFPVIVVLIDCLHRLSQHRASEFSWLYCGGAIWIVATLASSVTLITLFSTSGLALTAVYLTLLVQTSASDMQQAGGAWRMVRKRTTLGVQVTHRSLTT